MNFYLSKRSQNPLQLIAQSFLLYQHIFKHVFYPALIICLLIILPDSLRNIFFDNFKYSNEGKFSSTYSNINLLLGFLPFVCNIISVIVFALMIRKIVNILLINDKPSIPDLILNKIEKGKFIIHCIIGFGILSMSLNMIWYVISSFYFASVFFLSSSNYSIIALIPWLILILCLSISFYFYLPIAIIKQKSVVVTIKNTLALSWKNYCNILLVQLIPLACFMLLLTIARALPKSSYMEYVSYFLIIVFIFVITPWIAASLVVQLNDLELKRKKNNTNLPC